MIMVFGTIPVSAKSKSPKLSKTKLTLKVGQSKTIKLKNVSSKAIKNGEVTFLSENEKIATVGYETGKITGVKKGKTVVNAFYDGKIYPCKVTVKKASSGSTKITDEYKSMGSVQFQIPKGYERVGKEALGVDGFMYMSDAMQVYLYGGQLMDDDKTKSAVKMGVFRNEELLKYVTEAIDPKQYLGNNAEMISDWGWQKMSDGSYVLYTMLKGTSGGIDVYALVAEREFNGNMYVAVYATTAGEPAKADILDFLTRVENIK